MIKNVESLGTVLTREEQKQVNGGAWICITILSTTICYDNGLDPGPYECIPDGLPGSGGPGVGCPSGTSCSSTGECV